jgi:thiol:disulfide interchange protein/DsbC/DsbD-like thiol-disulfide interchange protein
MFKRVLCGLVTAAATWVAHAASGAVVTTPQVRAELLAHAPQGVVAGQTLQIGLAIRHAPKWHTYWKNPGDSGLATQLNWTLPAGFAAGDIQWPTPQKLPIGPLMNYGYEGDLLLPVVVQVPAGFNGSSLPVKLQADWLVCKEVCIPESGEFAIDIPAQAAASSHAARFEATRASMPQDVAGARATAALEGDALVVRISGLPAAWQGKAIDFLPETAGVIANAERQQARWAGDNWESRVRIDPQRSESPSALHAVLLGQGEAVGLRVAVQVSTPWPAPGANPGATSPATTPSTLAPALAQAQAQAQPPLALPLALVFAFLGGLLLNLMPCVFPVLSLKVLGVAQHGSDRHTLLSGGLAYTVGVVLSFVALAALLLALRAGGEQLGWGFQLQNPWVVAALALLFTLIGLNLAGLFEFGSVLPSSVASARARNPMVDQFLTGVLAVAVASPCTAPFMGASLGLALTLPTAQALLLFAVLGLGMAAPYLALMAWPRLAERLPRPGVWMQHFKGLMAFPMFATVVWLMWVLGNQVGVDGAAALLGVLVAVAFVAWALGAPGMGSATRVGLGGVSLAVLALALAWAVPGLKLPAPDHTGSTAATMPSAANGNAASTSETPWQPWSSERVAAAHAQGRAVFVDFTAAWCVTCQYNKRTTLADARVMAAFRERGVLLLRADWTKEDPVITTELQRLQRSGVPVYALYTPGAALPQILGEILSVNEVLTALEPLPKVTTTSHLSLNPPRS